MKRIRLARIPSLAVLGCLSLACTLLVGCGPSYPLHSAIQTGKTEKALELIAKGKYINDMDAGGNAPLHWAAKQGETEVAERLLDAGVDVDVCTGGAVGATPLNPAAANGQLPVTRLLVERGATVDAKTNNGTTPLIIAAQNGHPDVVAYLLDQGADINAVIDGGTSLSLAAHRGHLDVVQLLIDRGADVNLTDAKDKTPLVDAVSKNHGAVAAVLIDAGSDVNHASSEGWTALMFAAREGDANSVTALVQAGARVDVLQPEHKFTPLDFAAFNDHDAVAEYLIEAGGKSAYTEDTRDGLYAAAVTSKLLARRCERAEGCAASVAYYQAAGDYYDRASESYKAEAKRLGGKITDAFIGDLVGAALQGAVAGVASAASGTYVHTGPPPSTDTSDLSRLKKKCNAMCKRCTACSQACRQIQECYENGETSDKTAKRLAAAKKQLGIL